MASFTDKTPRFNPYIQQLPVEAMAQVGMAKQKAHEEGVQKIQTQIDNIAGLDVARDVDKAYLQSKLNELGNKLKTVSAGDFSNFQLVNSTAGMTKQLINDRGIQTAVNSAGRLRKEQSFMEEERKKGELNPANEFVFNKQVNAWYNNSDVYQGFNGKYNKYFDVDKYTREVFAEVKPDSFTFDQIFQTDASGNPLIDPSTGTYKLSTTMSRLKKEGRFPEDVQKTLDYIFSDPRVNNQLSINGQYQYRNAAPIDLANRLTTVRDSQVNNYNRSIMDLTMKKSIIQDGVEKVKIDKQIEDLVAGKNDIVSNYNDLITNIDAQADNVRGMLYKAETKDKFKDMYSYVEEERTMHSNPAWEANFKMQQEANNMARHRDQMQIQLQKMAQDERLALMKMNNDLNIANAKTKKEEEAELAGYTTGPIDNPVDIISSFEQKGVDAWDNYTKSTDALLTATNAIPEDLIALNQSKMPGVPKEEVIKRTVNAMAKAAGKAPGAFRAELYNNAIKTFNQNANNLQPDKQVVFANAINASEIWQEHTNQVKSFKKRFPKEVIDTKSVKPVTVEISADFPWQDDTKVTLTKEDQINLAHVYNVSNNGFATSEEEEVAKMSRAALNKRGISDKMIDRLSTPIGVSKNYGQLGVNLEGLVKKVGSTKAIAELKEKAAFIRERSVFNPSVSKTLDVSEKVDKDNWNKIASYIGRYSDAGQNEAVNFKGNQAAMTAIAKDPKKGSIELRANKSNATQEITNTAIFYNDKGEQVGTMVLSGEEAASVGFKPEAVYSSPRKKFVESKMSATGNGSTAYGNVNDLNTYYYGDVGFNKKDFPNLSNMPNVDVKANIKTVPVINEDGTQSTLYFNYLYINDGKSGSFIKPLGSPTTRLGEAVDKLQNIAPQTINQIISEHKR